jgi:hypothetical protein
MQPTADLVITRLNRFRPISQPVLRTLLAWAPWVCAFLLLADWLIGRGAFSRDVLRLSAAVAAILELTLFNHIFTRLPSRLIELYEQGIIQDETDRQTFIRWLDRFEREANSRLAWIGGLILALAGLSLTYPILYRLKYNQIPDPPIDLWLYYTTGNGGFVAPLLGFFLGLLVWRAGVLAFNLYRLGRDIDLRVLPEHPDRCGGLRSLGDLCLQLAMVVLIPAIFLAFWGIIENVVKLQGLQTGAELYGDSARRWLLFLVAAGFFLFFLPLDSIHQRMNRRRLQVQRELAELSSKMEQIAAQLREQAEQMTPAQGKECLDQLEFMDKIYQRSRRFPTWPFDARLLAGFASAQALPLLSLLGVGEPITKGLLIILGWIQ